MTNKKVNQFTHGEPFILESIKHSKMNAVEIKSNTMSIITLSECVSDGNAQLIAESFKAATKLAEMGYDAVKVLEKLPELVRVISNSGLSGKDINDIKELLVIMEMVEDLEV